MSFSGWLGVPVHGLGSGGGAGGGITGPWMGVTDGSYAGPGEVGELWHTGEYQVTVPQSATWFVQLVPIGVLPPGDWDLWGWLGVGGSAIQHVAMDNIPLAIASPTDQQIADAMPPGVSWFGMYMGVSGGAEEAITAPTTTGWAHTSVWTQITMRLLTIAPVAAAWVKIDVVARRRR